MLSALGTSDTQSEQVPPEEITQHEMGRVSKRLTVHLSSHYNAGTLISLHAQKSSCVQTVFISCMFSYATII